MGGTFFAMAFFAFASLTTVDLLMNERAVSRGADSSLTHGMHWTALQHYTNSVVDCC